MLKWTPKRIVGGVAVLAGASLFVYVEPLFMHESSAYAGGFFLRADCWSFSLRGGHLDADRATSNGPTTPARRVLTKQLYPAV